VYQDNKKATSSKKKLIMVTNFMSNSTSNFYSTILKFHLQNQIWSNFKSEKQCYELMVQKKHLTGRLAHVLFCKDLREMVLLEKLKYNK
jgi:hypothetical protein